MVAVKVYAVFFAAALSKRVVMVAGERGEHGNAEESIVEKVTVTVKVFCFLPDMGRFGSSQGGGKSRQVRPRDQLNQSIT